MQEPQSNLEEKDKPTILEKMVFPQELIHPFAPK